MPAEDDGPGAFFSGAAWAALVPSAPPAVARPLYDGDAAPPPECDAGAGAREAAPLVPADFLAAFRKSAFHRGLLALVAANPPLGTNTAARFLVYSAPRIALAAAMVNLPAASDLFDTRGYAVGMAALVYHELIFAAGVPVTLRLSRALSRTPDTHPFAPYLRWYRLCADADDLEKRARGGRLTDELLEHDAGGKGKGMPCPCPAATCGGRVLHKSAVLQCVWYAMLCIVGIFGWGAVEFWTPLVTFAGATWSSPWRAALSAYVLACLAIYVVNHGIDLFATDFALIGLEGRLQARAAAVCLSDLVSRHCTATEGGVASTGLDSPGAAASSTAAPRAPEPFVYLHQAMAPVWRSFKGSTSSVMLQLGFIGVNVLVSVLINIIGAGCVTAWQFFAIFNTCTLFLRPFINAAVANRSTSAVAALYRRCRTDLDRLLLDRPDHPDAARMRDCARLLGVFESSAREDRATVLGFVADLGFLRGAMLALVTVGVGMLHGILRGAGVTVTMQTVCPA